MSKLNSTTSRNNTSGVKGVHWNARTKKWNSKLTFQKITYSKEFIEKQDAINYRKELEEK